MGNRIRRSNRVLVSERVGTRSMGEHGSEGMDMNDRRWMLQLASLVSGLVLFFVAASAQAGGPSAFHPMKISGSGFQQGVSEKTGDDQIEKGKFSDKVLGGACTDQESLGKGQAVVLAFDTYCGDPNDNAILVIQTDPFDVIANIGDVEFDLDFSFEQEKKGELAGVLVPVDISLACVSGLIDIDVEVSAIASVKFDDNECIEGFKAKNGIGVGLVDGEEVIIDRTKADAKKPIGVPAL